MITNASLLARKYAKAFVHIFADSLTDADLTKVGEIKDKVAEINHLSFFLQLPTISDPIKKEKILTLFNAQETLHKALEKLVQLLLTHKRAALIPFIVPIIYELLLAHKNIQTFTITSSAPLDSDSLEQVQAFLAQKTGSSILYKENIDKTLIAGLRLQSSYLLWEHSIKKYLTLLGRAAHFDKGT